MEKLGLVRNRTHQGMFIVLCDAEAEFKGWDEYGEVLADEGNMNLDLQGKRAVVLEAHSHQLKEAGAWLVFRGAGDVLFLQPPLERGVERLEAALLADEPRTETVAIGDVDVPSGTLTIALAYPPLNTETDGDHAGVTHGEGERLDVAVGHPGFTVQLEWVREQQVIALRPRTSS